MPDAFAPDLVGIVPLRAGSKGLPGKNIRELAGKPLYRHALDQALRVIGSCMISTDIEELHQIPMPDHCHVLRRPQHLGEDTTPMADVLVDLFISLAQANRLPQTAVLLQATSPLRGDEDIHEAIRLYRTGHYNLVMSVTAVDNSAWKYGILEDGAFTPLTDAQNCFSNRQELPELHRPNGAVYVFSPKQFLTQGGFPNKRIGAFLMPDTRSSDIDNEDDLKQAEAIISAHSNVSCLRGVA